MVYFLFDNPADKKNMEFLKEYDTASFKLLFPKEQCLSVQSMIKVCNDCIRNSCVCKSSRLDEICSVLKKNGDTGNCKNGFCFNIDRYVMLIFKAAGTDK